MRLAVDLGGTHLRWRIGQDGEVHKLRTADLDLISFLSDVITSNNTISSIGMAFAGHTHNGVLYSAPNIPVKNLEIAKIINEKFGLPLFCDNDLKCAVRAEASIRPNAKTIIAMFIGTGLGGAFFDHGMVVQGCSNLAGEVGHSPFKPSNVLCGCGKNDCVEIYASGSGIDKRLAKIGLKHETLAQAKLDAPEIYNDFLDALIHASSTLITLLNPDALVLGGGIAEAEPWILDAIKDGVVTHTFPPAQRRASIELSTFDNAVLEGAGLLF
jgi:glucokinase